MRALCRESLVALLLSVAAVGLLSCRRTPEQSYATLLESGSKYLENKDYVRAIIQFKNAARQSPRNAEAYYRLGVAYLASGSVREAVVALVRAAEADPKHAGAQIKLAELLANSRDKTLLEDSRKRLQEVLSVSPNQGDALTALALTESRMGDIQAAEQHLRQALRGSPASLKASVVLARIMLARRDLAGAEQVLQSVIDQTPRSADARLALAELYLSLNRLPEAEKALRAALDIDNKNAQAMLGLAAIYSASGRREDAGLIYRQVSGLGDGRYRHLYGAYLFNEGKREAAIQEFEKLARQSPADRDARSRLVAAYLAVKRTTDAERLLNSALQQNPRDVDALLLKSEVLLRAGNLGEAQKNLAEVLRYKPASAEAHLSLARIYGARGNTLLQRKELTEAVGLRPDLLEARIELARNLIDSNSAAMALDLLDKAPPAQKQTIVCMVLRNHALFATGNQTEFAKGVSEGLRAARIPDLLVQEGQLKLVKGDYAGARASLTEALQRNPEHLGALDVMLQVYSAQKNLSAGLGALRAHAAQHPRSARVQNYFGERLLAAGRLEEARRVFTAAKAAEPASVEADLALAQIDLLEGNLDAARSSLAGLASSAADRPIVHLLLASVETKSGNYPAAMEHYRKVLEADPNHVLALNNLAYLLAEYARRPDEALKYAQKAKELQPDNMDIGGTIGRLYYNKGIYATALQYLSDAVTRDATAPGRNPVLRKYYLGMTYLKLGQRQQGLQVLEQAFRLGPDLPEAQLARAAIRETAQAPRQ
jgi:Tfp pilus assembly protein PilF